MLQIVETLEREILGNPGLEGFDGGRIDVGHCDVAPDSNAEVAAGWSRGNEVPLRGQDLRKRLPRDGSGGHENRFGSG